MIARVGGGDVRILAACLPVKLAGFHDNAAEGRAVAADELCSGVYHDVRAVLDGTDQIRGAEGVVDHQRKAVLVCDRCDRIDVRNVTVGVAQRLQIDGTRVVPDRPLDLREIVCVNKGGLDAVLRQGVGKEIEASAVDGLLCYDVAAVRCQRLNGVGDGRCAGRDRQSRAAAFQSGQSFFQDILRRIGQSSVDIAGIRETEAVRCVLAVVEYIGSGLIDRHGTRVGRGIRLFLSYVQL